MRRSLILGFLFVAGCQTKLDIQQQELIEVWGKGNAAFAAAIATHRDITNKAIGKVFNNQRAILDARWEKFLDDNSLDGNLILTDSQDRPVLINNQHRPMKRKDLESWLGAYRKGLLKIDADEREYKQIDAKLLAAIETFSQLNQSSLATNAEIAAAKASAQALFEQALTAVGSIATSVLVQMK